MFGNSLERQVRKVFRKGGWEISGSYVSRLIASREIFTIHVLLGPEQYDTRFPIVDNVYSKNIFDIKLSCGEWIPNILVVVEDRATLPLYERLSFDGVAVLHLDDLHLVNGVELARLSAETPEAELGWADRFIKMNAKLSAVLAQHAASLGNAGRAVYWAS